MTISRLNPAFRKVYHYYHTLCLIEKVDLSSWTASIQTIPDLRDQRTQFQFIYHHSLLQLGHVGLILTFVLRARPPAGNLRFFYDRKKSAKIEIIL